MITDRKKAEMALKESNELLTRFINYSPIYAYIKQVEPDESTVIVASENFQDMVGIPGSQMIGKRMEDLFPPEFAKKITPLSSSFVGPFKGFSIPMSVLYTIGQ